MPSRPRPLFYVLDPDMTPRAVATVEEWATWFELTRPQMVDTLGELGEVVVSTVFLGIDHGFGGKVLLFETMVFGPGGLFEDQDRYETWEEAKRGHEDMVELTRERMADLRRRSEEWVRQENG